MKTFMKILEYILKKSDKIFKFAMKLVLRQQKKLESDKRDDDAA